MSSSINDKGNSVFKLDQIAPQNDIEHFAHDALGDVKATIDKTGVRVNSEARCVGKTGIEMEALTAASISALTIYDMVKSVDKSIIIKDLRLIFKNGGKSGRYESS